MESVNRLFYKFLALLTLTLLLVYYPLIMPYYYSEKYASGTAIPLAVLEVMNEVRLNQIKANETIKNMSIVSLEGKLGNGITSKDNLELTYDTGIVRVKVYGSASKEKIMQLNRDDIVFIKGEVLYANTDKNGKVAIYMEGIIE